MTDRPTVDSTRRLMVERNHRCSCGGPYFAAINGQRVDYGYHWRFCALYNEQCDKVLAAALDAAAHAGCRIANADFGNVSRCQ